MKKSVQANINGIVFYIDEDAYTLLGNYLDQLRKAFPGDEGKEIVCDIEARISEIFAERIASGINVIVIDDVNNVIERMGRPGELSNSSESAPSCETDIRIDSDTVPPPYCAPAAQDVHKRLYRNERDKIFGGVLGGLAAYMGWNANIMRLLVVVISVFTAVWPMVILYLLAWMIIPPARTAQQYLELTGKPVTIGNLGQTVINNDSYPAPTDNMLYTLLNIAGKGVLILIGLICAGFVIGGVVLFIATIAGLIMSIGWNNYDVFYELDLFDNVPSMLGAVGSVLFSIAILIPATAASWGICSVLFKVKGMSKVAVISLLVVEVILVIATIILLTQANSYTHYAACVPAHGTLPGLSGHSMLAMCALSILPLLIFI